MLVINDQANGCGHDKRGADWYLDNSSGKIETGSLGPPIGIDGNNNDQAAKTKLEVLASKVPCLGIMMSLGASVFLATANVLVKLTHSVSGVQVAVFR